MLRLIAAGWVPRPLHRLAYRLAHAGRRIWWRLARPRVVGCRVLALDGQGRVLLVRHSYGSGNWMAPGGGLARGEDPIAGGVRELAEEAGCRLEGAWQVALAVEPLQGATNIVHLVAGRCSGEPVPDGREIVAAAFFAVEALPAALPELLRRDLPGWLRAARAGRPGEEPGAGVGPPTPTA